VLKYKVRISAKARTKANAASQSSVDSYGVPCTAWCPGGIGRLENTLFSLAKM
jgi:hypothetical protein